jgi:hypothetical protein
MPRTANLDAEYANNMLWPGDETIRSVKRILDGWIDWDSVGGEVVVTLLARHGRCPCAVAKR